MFGVTSLFIYISCKIKVKSVCVCVCRYRWRNWYSCWYIYNAFADTITLKSLQMTTMIRILMDFKPILDLNLYSEHLPEGRITGSKIDLDLSAGSTYMWVYMIVAIIIIIIITILLSFIVIIIIIITILLSFIGIIIIIIITKITYNVKLRNRQIRITIIID